MSRSLQRTLDRFNAFVGKLLLVRWDGDTRRRTRSPQELPQANVLSYNCRWLEVQWETWRRLGSMLFRRRWIVDRRIVGARRRRRFRVIDPSRIYSLFVFIRDALHNKAPALPQIIFIKPPSILSFLTLVGHTEIGISTKVKRNKIKIKLRTRSAVLKAKRSVPLHSYSGKAQNNNKIEGARVPREIMLKDADRCVLKSAKQ